MEVSEVEDNNIAHLFCCGKKKGEDVKGLIE